MEMAFLGINMAGFYAKKLAPPVKTNKQKDHVVLACQHSFGRHLFF